MQLELWPEEPQVTREEVHDWVRQIGLDPESWRGQYYIRHRDVAGKIAAIKRQQLVPAPRASTKMSTKNSTKPSTNTSQVCRMAKKRPPQRFEITLEFEGKTYSANYYIQSKMVTLECAYGTTSTQPGGSPAVSIARILFGEFLRGAKARGEL